MLRTIGIDIRLLGKHRTGDEAVFFNLTKEILQLDSVNQYRLYTDETDRLKIATLHGQLGCVGNPRVSFVSLGSSNRFLWNLFFLPWSLFRDPVDVFHTQYIAPLWLPRRTKLVTHIHDVSFAAHPEWIAWRDLLFLKLLLPRSLRRSSAIIAPSKFTCQELIRLYRIDNKKIFLIENAVAPEWHVKPKPEEQAQVIKKFHIPGPYFISLGTMQPRKNIARLIQAFSVFHRHYPETSLVLVGNLQGKNVDPLVIQEQNKTHPYLIFTGYVSERELRSLVARSVGLLFPSLYEGFGLPLLEAFSLGVPVGASDIPVFHEVAGEGALYFDPMNIDQIEKIMYTLYIDKKTVQLLQTEGSKQARFYSWQRSALKLKMLYESV